MHLIAALLSFSESHAGDEKLPSEVQRHQTNDVEPATEKEIFLAHAQSVFVKPTHSDIKPGDKIQWIK